MFRTRHLPLFPLAALLLSVVACKEKSSPPAATPTAADPSPPPAPITAEDPTPLPGFEADALRSDPDLATWEAETLNEEAGSLLKKLAKLLVDHASLEGADLSGILSPEFTSSPLQPADLAVVFDRAGITVSRAPALDPAPTPATSSDLRAAMRGLLTPLDEHSHVRAAFKIVGVDLTTESPSTEVLVQFSWATGMQRHQVNATWQCHWDRSDDGTVRLRHLDNRAARFERITGDTPGPLLADRTVAVLGSNPSYRDQLRHGSDYWMARIEGAYGIDLMDPQGIAVADVNGDGLDDLYLCQPGGLPNRLFLAQPDGTALDHSAAAGLDFRDFCRHALFVDLDNDGDQDLAVLLATTALFLENDGHGVFEERVRWSIPGNPYSFTAADYDHDRLLDIFLVVRDADPANRKNSLLGDPVPYHDANNGGANVMLRNEGGFSFREVTGEIGLDQNNRRFSQAAAWEDYDNDGDLDLYVANDFGRNNLYRNDGGTFTDVAAAAGVEDLSAGMSVSWADYNRDGRMDLYVGNMFSSAGNRITYQRRFKAGVDQSTVAGFQRHARGNSLFENLGDGSFRDVSVESGTTMGRWAWASPFVDFNNDRWPDLAVANGFITNEDSGDL